MPAGKYDWGRWFSKKSFTLRKGKHYQCSQASVCQSIRNRATRERLKISLSFPDDGSVRVDVLGPMPTKLFPRGGPKRRKRQ